jgi:hypothetical protein
MQAGCVVLLRGAGRCSSLRHGERYPKPVESRNIATYRKLPPLQVVDLVVCPTTSAREQCREQLLASLVRQVLLKVGEVSANTGLAQAPQLTPTNLYEVALLLVGIGDLIDFPGFEVDRNR